MQHLPGRRAHLTAGIKLAALVAMPLALFRAAGAQGVEIGLGETDTAAELSALRQRLDALETQLQRLDDEHSRIRAPLVVVGPDQAEVFTVDVDSSGRGRLRLGDPGGSHVIIGMTDQGSGMSLKDSGGKTRVQIAAGADLSQLWVEDSKAQTLMGSSADGSTTGLAVYKNDVKQLELATDKAGGMLKTFDVQGIPISEISAAEDTPLLLYDLTGKPFFSVGLPDTDKRLLTLGDPAATRVEVGVTTDGTGAFVAMMDKAGSARAVMNVDEEEPAFAAYQSGGKEVFAVGPKGQGGPFQMRVGEAEAASVILGLVTGGTGSFVSVQDKAGTPRAAINADPDEPPIVVSDDSGTVVFKVGPDKGQGPMNLVLGEPEKQHVDIGLFGGGGGLDGAYVTLYDNAGNERTLVSTDDLRSIVLYDRQGKPTFSVAEPSNGGPLRLLVGEEDKAHAMLGLLGGDSGAHLAIFDAQGQQRAAINGEGPDAMAIYDADGTPTFSVGIPEDGGFMTLNVGEREKAHLQTGVLKDGSGAYLSLYDQSYTERAHVTATEKSTQMSLNDANMTADLGSSAGDIAGLFMRSSDGSINYASLRFSKADGGVVLVKDPEGNTVVQHSVTKAGGGQVAVTGPGGQRIIGRFWADSEGGKLGLYDAEGTQRVGAAASQKGDLNLYGEGGTFTATSGETHPEMMLSDAEGNILADAFVTRSGLGTVSVGPVGNGVASTLGNMGLAASALLGTRK